MEGENKKEAKQMDKLNFKVAFKYPFNRVKGMLNILWILLPIIGWFALGGYGIRIIKEFSKGKFEKLPVFEFKKNLKLGFLMWIKSIPFMVFYLAIIVVLEKIDPVFSSLVNFFLSVFITPMLIVNFFNKETIESIFEFKILKQVFDNLGDYIVAMLKNILLGVLFLIMLVVLVGIPAGSFTQNIFLADFYRRKIWKKDMEERY